MKFLVPTDFSKNAANAIDYASVLAKATASELILLNVYTPQVSRKNVAYPFLTDEMALAMKEANDQLALLCQEVSERGISCSQRVVAGDPVDEIVHQAGGEKADLIVMGTQGASGMSKLFFGSNTTSVMERTTCNVMAIPSHTKPWVPQKVVFATDYHNSDLQTMKKLARVASLINAEIVVLHVSKKNLKSERDMIEKFTKEVAAETGLPQPYYYVTAHEDAKEGIEQVVESLGADLIAMSTRRRSVFSKLFDTSLTRQIASQARLPLLAFHVTE